MLSDAGHEVLVTSRDKDCTLELLERYGIEHQCISKQNSGGFSGMASELAGRNFALWRVVRQFKPDVLAAIGGIWAAQVGWLMRKPSVIFYDTESARVQNALTYPFATRIVVPYCYQGKLPEHKAVRYSGYHELSYLHPDYFTPSREIAVANGLATNGDTFLIRLVSWKASHDVGLIGWSEELLDAVVAHLSARGKVIISSEGKLPTHLEPLSYTGDLDEIHHVIGNCRAYVGESATMASEAVVMGVPAIYAATESRGYVDEQADRYQMANIVKIHPASAVLAAVDEMLIVAQEEIDRRHHRLLKETIDVAKFAVSRLANMQVIH